MFGGFQTGPFQLNFQQEGVVVTPLEPVQVQGGIPSRGVARRRYIMPDGRMFLASTDEALQLLRMYSVPKEVAEEPKSQRQAKGQPVIRAPQITLEKRDVRFVPETDAAEGTYKALISERFVYRAPEEAYRQAEIMLNRMRDDEEALLLLL
jgi:hypothetical protein